MSVRHTRRALLLELTACVFLVPVPEGATVPATRSAAQRWINTCGRLKA